MKDEKIEMRNNIFKSLVTQNEFYTNTINTQLTLRKQKIQENLMSKRLILSEKEINENSLAVDINKLNAPENLKKNYEIILKTTYEIKQYLPQLFGLNLNDKKLALFLLRNFIILQIKELPFEKRKLSNNDEDLFKGLCNLLFDKDFQVKYEVSWCLINIPLFPRVIENKLYSDENLNVILNFILNCDEQFYCIVIYILRNYSNNDSNKIFFIHNGALKKAIDIISNDMNNEFLIKHSTKFFRNIIKILNKYPNEIDNLISLIPLLQKIMNNFIKNPLKDENDYISLLESLEEFSKCCYKKTYNLIMNDNFSKTIIDFLKQLNDNEIKLKTFYVILNMLSYDESFTQLLLDEGLCQLIKQLLYEFKFNNMKFLANIILAISNIASGTISQIELLNTQEIFEDIIEIGKCYIENYNPNNHYFKIVIRECIYSLCNAINGGTDGVKQNIIIYQDSFIINILFFGLKEFILKKENKNFLSSVILTIKICVIQSEDIMVDEYNLIKQNIIKNQGEDLFNKILNDELITDYDKKNIDIILDSIKEKNEYLLF